MSEFASNAVSLKTVITNDLSSTSAMKILLQHNVRINWHCPFLGDNFVYFPVISSWKTQLN